MILNSANFDLKYRNPKIEKYLYANRFKTDSTTKLIDRAYRGSHAKNMRCLIVNDLGDEGDCIRFVKKLNDFDVNTFVLTEDDEKAMKHLHHLLAEGWNVKGLTTVRHGSNGSQGFVQPFNNGLILERNK